MLSGFQHPDIVLASGYPSELDIYFPNLKLAIEYQGEQHFKSLNFMHNVLSLEERKLIDEQKNELCKRIGEKNARKAIENKVLRCFKYRIGGTDRTRV